MVGLNMKIYDVSAQFSPQLPFYPGDVVMDTQEFMSMSGGDIANISLITFGTHTGTHFDTPKHMIDSGKTLDDFPIERFTGSALVVEARGKPAVTAEDIRQIQSDIFGKTVLFKTDNVGAMWDSNFKKDYVYISDDAAQLLAEAEPNCVGIDYLSIEKLNSPSFGAHKALMKKDILILEGLVLDNVPPGEYLMMAFPLKIPGGNGSPARVVLIESIDNTLK